jgi:peptidoglycan/xylan/chitin deacetylase (PgdA/CDA1 family)
LRPWQGSSGRPPIIGDGYVGLTFDDGPHPRTTTALLDALRGGGARATFFVWGAHAARHPGLLRAVLAAGMWVGNHTYTHPDLTRLRGAAVSSEIVRTQRTVRRITGRAPTLFRPPFGRTSVRVRAAAQRLGLTEVLWTVDTRDWAGPGPARIVRAAAAVQPGGIILMHDNGSRATVDAVPRILEELAARGLRPGRIECTPEGPVAVAP